MCTCDCTLDEMYAISYKNTADEESFMYGSPFPPQFLGGIFRSDLVSHNFDYICIQLFILYSVLNLSFYLIIMT